MFRIAKRISEKEIEFKIMSHKCHEECDDHSSNQLNSKPVDLKARETQVMNSIDECITFREEKETDKIALPFSFSSLVKPSKFPILNVISIIWFQT